MQLGPAISRTQFTIHHHEQRLEASCLDARHDVDINARHLLKGIESVYMKSMSTDEEVKRREHDWHQIESNASRLNEENETLRKRLLDVERERSLDGTVSAGTGGRER